MILYIVSLCLVPIRAVLDTNVLFSGLYSSRGASFQVLRLIERGLIRLSLSTVLLFEYEDVLKRNTSRLNLRIGDIEELLDSLCKMSDHFPIFFLWRPYLPDPKDDHVLELAVASQTSTIITHNVKDFRDIHQFGVRAMTPQIILEGQK